MNQMERLFQQYKINIVYVDATRLISLSEFEQDRYTKEDLMSCIANRAQVDAAMMNPMLRFKGPNGPVLAAIMI